MTQENEVARRCVYCANPPDKTKGDTWTVEHVLPEAIGGDLIDGEPFELPDVCSYCNNRFGQWVDGPYIRSFITNEQRVSIFWRYVDLAQTPIIPFLYRGQSSEVSLPSDYVCDVWLGPGGDQVFHVHHPYPSSCARPKGRRCACSSSSRTSSGKTWPRWTRPGRSRS